MRHFSEKATKYIRPIALEKINLEILRRYVDMRNEVNYDIETIQGITRALSLLQDGDDSGSIVNTSAVIHINEVLAKHATNVWNVLDNFIPIAFAVIALEKAEQNVDAD